MCSGPGTPLTLGHLDGVDLPTQEEPSQVFLGDCHPGPTASLLSGSCLLSPWVYLSLSLGLAGPRFRSSLPQLHSCKARKRDRGQGTHLLPSLEPEPTTGIWGGQGLSRLDLFSGLGTSFCPVLKQWSQPGLVLALPSPARVMWVRGRRNKRLLTAHLLSAKPHD